jgi:hypothetical protein
MTRIANDSFWLTLGLLCCYGAAGCVGTPTPEPPDFLPLDGSLVSMGPVPSGEVGAESTLPVSVLGEPGAVQGGTSVWLVNLDSDLVSPVYAEANPDGSFSAEISGQPGDRVRLLSRSPFKHSLPIDFEIIFANAQLGLSRLADTSLACLEVSPEGEISLSGNSEQAFVITNHCTDSVRLVRSTLRFADQGFSLAPAPSSIAPGASADVVVAFGPETQAERAEILLIDVLAGKVSGRYALGLWGR